MTKVHNNISADLAAAKLKTGAALHAYISNGCDAATDDTGKGKAVCDFATLNTAL